MDLTPASQRPSKCGAPLGLKRQSPGVRDSQLFVNGVIHEEVLLCFFELSFSTHKVSATIGPYHCWKTSPGIESSVSCKNGCSGISDNSSM